MASPNPQIPRKGISEPSYAVSRPEAASSSSASPLPPLHTETDTNNDDNRPNTPPPYSGPTTPQPQSQIHITTPQQTLYYPGLPRLDYRLYTPHSFVLSSDHTTLTSYEPRLSTHAPTLLSLIQSLATIPPKPQVRITGKSSDGRVDFDIRLNFMNLIVPDDVKRRMNYVRVIGKGEMGFRGEVRETAGPDVGGGLEAWVRRFCEDGSSIKHFALERTVTNWDTSYLEGRLLSLISSTSYRGHVTITFPQTHSRVVIRNPDKVNRFFSNVTKVFTGTKKYEIIKSIWPYADVARGEPGRHCVVQEEEAWFASWRDSIRYAILGKRVGWVTVEDRLEFLMEPRVGDREGKPADWGAF